MQQKIEQTVLIPHEPSVVWDYLTQPALIAQWLMPTDMVAEVGHEFQFTARPMPNYNFDGVIRCIMLEVIPHEKLSYSWKGGNEGVVTFDSVVVWTLTPNGGGTELKLVHTGFETPESAMFQVMNHGWQTNMNKIGGLILTR